MWGGTPLVILDKVVQYYVWNDVLCLQKWKNYYEYLKQSPSHYLLILKFYFKILQISKSDTKSMPTVFSLIYTRVLMVIKNK